jgi:hypothetical protein
MALMRCGNGFESGETVDSSFTYANENSRGEWDSKFTSRFESGEATFRRLIWCASMTGKVPAQRFNHHSLAG